MRRGVAGVGSQCGFKSAARLVHLVLVGVKHAQVVVGLGQVGKLFRQSGKGGYCICGFTGIALGHAFEKTHLRVARLVGEKAVRLGDCLGVLSIARQLGYVTVFISTRRSSKGCEKQSYKDYPGAAKHHGAVEIFRERGRNYRRYTVRHCSGGGFAALFMTQFGLRLGRAPPSAARSPALVWFKNFS